MPREATPRARRGRRSGPTSTRQAVLEAARVRFARDGFAAATIRRIAADAGVDASQVMQFFGSKDDLFAAVMAIPASAIRRFDTAFEGPDEHLGERVVRAYLAAWEETAEESEPLMAMLRGAIVNEDAGAQLRDFIQSRLLHGTTGRGGQDAMLRAGLASAMLVGIVTSRRVIGVPVLFAADTEQIVATVAPAIQQVLAGPVTGPGMTEKLSRADGGGRPTERPVPPRTLQSDHVRSNKNSPSPVSAAAEPGSTSPPPSPVPPVAASKPGTATPASTPGEQRRRSFRRPGVGPS